MTYIQNRLAASLALAGALALGAVSTAEAAGQESVFAQFLPMTNKTNLTWSNNIVPAVYKTIPAVTQTIPAVTKIVPAVTKIVNGKVVIVTPAKTVVVTPAKTIVITPAQKVLVTAAHDGANGSLFSTTATNAKTFGVAQTAFKFLIVPLSKLGMLSAQFRFQATSPVNDPALTFGTLIGEADLSGTFSFTYDGVKPLKVWGTTYHTGANLLSGDIKDFLLDGANGGKSGAILASSSLGSVSFTSDFLDFSHTTNRELSFNLLTTTRFQADAGAALHTISGNGGGAFASTRPRLTAVPEPSTWALAIGGFALAGLALRRRRALALA